MGMFDREPNLSTEDWSTEPFDLLEGEYLGEVKSADYGTNRKARVVVVDPQGERSTFSVYGVLADQIARMDNGDLPAKVKIEKQGNANVFVSVGDTSHPDL